MINNTLSTSKCFLVTSAFSCHDADAAVWLLLLALERRDALLRTLPQRERVVGLRG